MGRYCAQELRIPHSNIIIIICVRMLCDNYIWYAESEECATHPERGERARALAHVITEARKCAGRQHCAEQNCVIYSFFVFCRHNSSLCALCSSIRYARVNVCSV